MWSLTDLTVRHALSVELRSNSNTNTLVRYTVHCTGHFRLDGSSKASGQLALLLYARVFLKFNYNGIQWRI